MGSYVDLLDLLREDLMEALQPLIDEAQSDKDTCERQQVYIKCLEQKLKDLERKQKDQQEIIRKQQEDIRSGELLQKINELKRSISVFCQACPPLPDDIEDDLE